MGYFNPEVINEKVLYLMKKHGSNWSKPWVERTGGLVPVNPILPPGLTTDVRPVTLTSRLERLPGFGDRIGLFTVLCAKKSRGDDIVQHAHALERPDDLERPPHAPAADLVRFQAGNPFVLEKDVPAGRLVEAVHDVEDRGLARAVRPDEPMYRAPLDVQVELAQGDEAPVALGEVPGLNDGFGIEGFPLIKFVAFVMDRLLWTDHEKDLPVKPMWTAADLCARNCDARGRTFRGPR